jgi:hypothetical protein
MSCQIWHTLFAHPIPPGSECLGFSTNIQIILGFTI